uniref:Uncharacterized protein n=1 Tax=Octopus bimaculoides TaxID=37653 RepID=A0A0L8H0R0_OCTBM
MKLAELFISIAVEIKNIHINSTLILDHDLVVFRIMRYGLRLFIANYDHIAFFSASILDILYVYDYIIEGHEILHAHHDVLSRCYVNKEVT